MPELTEIKYSYSKSHYPVTKKQSVHAVRRTKKVIIYLIISI